MEGGLEDGNSIVLLMGPRVSNVLGVDATKLGGEGVPRSIDPWMLSQRTFSMCSKVVFPALSSPRKSSLACLFIRPSEERTS